MACHGFFQFHVIDSIQINKTGYWLLILQFKGNALVARNHARICRECPRAELHDITE